MPAIILAGCLLASVTPVPAQQDAEIAFWNSVKDSKSAAELQSYLTKYPNGVFSDLARIRLKGLETAPAAARPSVAPSAAPAPATAAPSPPSGTAPALTNAQTIREAQSILYNLNYRVRATGVLDDTTRASIREWQENVKRTVTGTLTNDELRILRRATVPVIWGALAYTPRGIHSTVWNLSSREEAERRALANCSKEAGDGSTCNIVTAARSACGALGAYTGVVEDKRHWGGYAAIRPTLQAAIDTALSECRSKARTPSACSLRATFCADGSHKTN